MTEKITATTTPHDFIEQIVHGLLTEITSIGYANAPFEIKPQTVIPPELLSRYGLQVLASSNHLAAKHVMDSEYVTKHRLSIWYDEMPGAELDRSGAVHGTDEPPLFFVQDGVRIRSKNPF
jgi:hypothetical protein